jgi:betaine-aldehyde dehydrogenase
MQDEVFGPVLAVAQWDDLEAAISAANDVRFGLTASVWTRDLARALTTVERLEAGYVWVNDVETRYPAVPFGGWKDSGLGLEHGLDELLTFVRIKSVNVGYGTAS